jgi:hypothetical protein
MGTDICSIAIDSSGANITTLGVWTEGEPFGPRNYRVYGFLAGVRNYSAVKPIAEQRGLPADIIFDASGGPYLGYHSFSWLSVAELEAIDYDEMMENRRVTRVSASVIDGACTANAGDGKVMTYREFLGASFFADIAELRRIGADRVAFGFDS